MFYLTADGSGLPREPFAAIVAPRPIAWISTRGSEGATNLAPYSFYNAVAYTPPQVMIASIGAKADRAVGKDSFSHIVETSVFCINVASFDDRQALNASSAEYRANESEIDILGLEAAECETIDCPRIVTAPAAMECRLSQVIDLEGRENRMIIARVEAIHIRDDYLTEDGQLDITRYRPLVRLGYQDFAAIDDVFVMKRPRLPNV